MSGEGKARHATQTLQRLSAFWDERYADPEYVYGREPNDFLVQQAHHIPPGAPVLCVADGEGRNSVWLAAQGHAVTAVDVSAQGLRKARALAAERRVALDTVRADLSQWDLGEARWGAIASIFLHLPLKARADLHARCLRALKPGGVFLYEAYGRGQLGRDSGGPADPALLPQLDELLAEFPGADVLWRFAGPRELGEGRLHRGQAEVVQLVLRRPG